MCASRHLPPSAKHPAIGRAAVPAASGNRPQAAAAAAVSSARAMKLPSEDDLGAEQLSIIELPAYRDYLIEGQEGTGKTVTALYRAKKISEKSRDAVILLVPDHKDMLSMRAAVRRNHEFDGVTIDTFTSWIKDFYKTVLHKKVPKTDTYGNEKSETDWGQVARDSYAGVDTCGHMILDEGQEFPPELVKAIGLAARYVTCFMDTDKAAKKGKTSVSDACAKLLIEAPRTMKGNFLRTPYGVAGEDGEEISDRDVIELLEGTVSGGLSLTSNRSLYLLVADMLAKLYIRTGDCKQAINYLMDIDDTSPDVPDSIHLSYLYAQIMTDGIRRLSAEPAVLFKRLDRISPASFSERAELYRNFLKRLTELGKEDPALLLNLPRFRKQTEKYTGIPDLSSGEKPGDRKPAPAEGTVFDEEDVEKLREILSKDPEVLSDKKRIKGLISDYYFDDPLKKNIFRAIIEDDLAKELSGTEEADPLKVMRLCMKLSGTRGIERKLAEPAILCFCGALSVKITR